MNSLSSLSTSLNIQFISKEVLETAMTHRSFLNENRDVTESNERLEFLGDAVLELIVSHFLFSTYKDYTEGLLTSIRSKIVQTKTLAAVARKLNLHEYIKLSKGETESGGANNESILADTFEALIGAIFVDRGIDKAKEFVNKNLLSDLSEIVSSKEVVDYKSDYQEAVQAQGLPTPVYKIIEESGPDHNKTFISGVFVAGKKTAQGKGHSKQNSEQAAAELALEKLSKKE